MVFIILLNYNGYKDTIECVESIKKQRYEDYRIIIVDNKSTDDSLVHLQKIEDDSVILLKSEQNGGFAAGCNIGISYVLTNKDKWGIKDGSFEDYILLLNNDTIVEKDFLPNLVQAYTSSAFEDKQVGMAGCKIMYYDKTDTPWYAGGSFSTLRCRGKHFVTEDIKVTAEIDFITGCCQLIPIAVVEQVGLMEEDFFLYFEDVEYCERIKNAGYKLIYEPSAVIYHKCGGSASYVSPTSIYYSNRARYMYICKYLKKVSAYFIFSIELFVKRILYRGEKRKAILRVYEYMREKNFRKYKEKM